MASIVWLDLEGNRHESEEFSDIESLKSYIEENKDNINIIESLDCDSLKSLCVEDNFYFEGLFQECINLVEVKEIIGTSTVKDSSYMFKGCSKLESIPCFDTSNVEQMRSMFNGCGSLESVPLFNTSKVEDMGFMFHGCRSLKSVPLFDTINVEDMGDMFSKCSSLKNVPCFNTSNVKEMWDIFSDCPSLDYIKSMKKSKKNPRIAELYNYVW